MLYLACCVGNLKIVELLLKYQVKARKVSGKTATLKKKKTGSKDDQSKPSMVATRTSFQTVPTPQQSSIQVSLFFRQIDCFKKKKMKNEKKKKNRKLRENEERALQLLCMYLFSLYAIFFSLISKKEQMLEIHFLVANILTYVCKILLFLYHF